MPGTEWEIAKSTKTCAATGRKLEVGEIYYAALREEGERFIRQDFSREAWPTVDKERFFSYWRTRLAEDEERRQRPTIDLEAVYGFFLALAEPTEARKQLFRYLVALILVRKRLLRLEGAERDAAGEHLILFDRRAAKTIRVVVPPFREENLKEAQEALSRIFECHLMPEELA